MRLEWVRLPPQAIVTLLRDDRKVWVQLGKPGERILTRTSRQRQGYPDEKIRRLRNLYAVLMRAAEELPGGKGGLRAARSRIKTVAIYSVADELECAVEHFLVALSCAVECLRQTKKATTTSRANPR